MLLLVRSAFPGVANGPEGFVGCLLTFDVRRLIDGVSRANLGVMLSFMLERPAQLPLASLADAAAQGQVWTA